MYGVRSRVLATFQDKGAGEGKGEGGKLHHLDLRRKTKFRYKIGTHNVSLYFWLEASQFYIFYHFCRTEINCGCMSVCWRD